MKAETTKSIKLGVWSAIGGAIITMIVGFSVGGWVLGSTSIEAGEEMAEKAVVERLVPICVAQFKDDSESQQKKEVMLSKGTWYQSEYVKEQGWATMPFEEEPESIIAEKCAVLIAQIDD